jgi:serine/threonine-protein kinase
LVSPVVGVSAPVAAPPEDEVVIDRETLRRRHTRREFWAALRSIVWLALALGAFVGLFYGSYHLWIKALPREVRVPSYIGLGKDDAAKALLKAGLTLRVGRETYDAKRPEGTVVSGIPEPGRLVRARRQVTVTISQGEAPVTMYDFSDLPLDKARQFIVQHAMRLGPVVEQFHDTVPRGSICGQYPEAGTPFRRSEPITLIVSRGKQPSEIDATTGQIPPEAIASTVPDPALADPVPFEETPSQSNLDGAVARSAMIRVQIPSTGSAQQVRIIVRDDSGERVVYSKNHEPGAKVAQRVRVRHAPNATALVRVYVGETLIKSEEF